MSVSILSTKLHIPRTFVLLSGPTGFGKTTFLSEFVAQLRGLVAWVSLDDVSMGGKSKKIIGAQRVVSPHLTVVKIPIVERVAAWS